MKPWIGWAVLGVGIFFAGWWLKGVRINDQVAKVQQAADTTIARLRADSAAQKAVAQGLSERLRLQRQDLEMERAKHQQTLASLSGLQLKTKATEQRLFEARSAADSLLSYPPLVAALRVELDSTATALRSSETLSSAKDSVIATSDRLLSLRATQLATAEQKAAALVDLNAALKKQLASERTNLWPKIKIAGSTVVVGALVLLVVTR